MISSLWQFERLSDTEDGLQRWKTVGLNQYGLTDIFKACDRRIGYRRLQILANTLQNEKAINIVQQRLRYYGKN